MKQISDLRIPQICFHFRPRFAEDVQHRADLVAPHRVSSQTVQHAGEYEIETPAQGSAELNRRRDASVHK